MPIPFQPLVARVDPDRIDLSLRVSRATDAWLELNDGDLLRVGEGSFAETSVTLRRVTATNPFLEGEETVQALRGNITRPLAIWVYGGDHYRLSDTLELLANIFIQRRYQMVRTIENVSETFDCYAS